jgi:hypothetical protein
VRWGIQPWFAFSRALPEEITACLLHKAYPLAALQDRGLKRRFVEGDICANIISTAIRIMILFIKGGVDGNSAKRSERRRVK